MTAVQPTVLCVFRVDADPVPWQRTLTAKGRRRVTPEKTRDWEQLVGLMARRARTVREPYEGPVRVRLDFARRTRRRADIDNLAKGVLDGLNGIVYRDDSQVVDLHATLLRGTNDPGVHIAVHAAPETCGGLV